MLHCVKNDNNQLVSNYHLILFLLISFFIFSKKKNIWLFFYTFLYRNHLLKNNISGFKQKGSCTHQYRVITYKVWTAFDANIHLEKCSFFPEFVQGIQLDEVWFEVFFDDRFNETLKEAGLLHNLNIFSSQKKIQILSVRLFSFL